jgi:hypothetical protein
MRGCSCFSAFGGLIFLSSQLLAQSAGTFVRTGDMTTARLTETATLLLDGRVLITGGLGGDRRLALESAELYDPATETFSPTGNMKNARAGHAATRLADGRILITGGYSGTEAEIYDPATSTFATAGNMTSSRSFHVALLLNSGKVLITGGHPLDGSSPYTASAEIYDPEFGVFTSASDMTVPRYNHKATLLPDGSVLIVPGSDGADYATSEVYDPRSGGFTSLPFTGSPGLVAATSNLLPNGKVLQTLHVAECDISTQHSNSYDPATATFAAGPEMNSRHCQQVSTVLPDGTVLIVGSLDDSTGTNPKAETYDIRSGSFSLAGQVLFGRLSPRMTLLNSGKVLITGGWLATSELYEPTPAAPALQLLAAANGQPAILHVGTHAPVSADNPATAGEALEIYCTGLIEGSVIPPQVAIGGRLAEVLYFGGAPGFAGLNQVNVLVPSKTAAGAIEARLTYLDRSSNSVSLAVQ